MKKFRLLLICGLAALAAMFPSDATAQRKGEMCFGVSGGYASYNHSGYTNLFFQYSPLKNLRVVPEVGYVFRNNDLSAFVMNCDLHFPFRVARGFSVYPLIGFTFNAWNVWSDRNMYRSGGDFGGGFELYFTDNLKMNLQGKYSWMPDTSGAFFSLGFAYIFK